MKKTLIVLALVLAMMMQLLPVAAFAETETGETEIVVIEPVAEETQPEVTEPEAAESETTEPEATEPEATEPESPKQEESEAEQLEASGEQGAFSGEAITNPLYPEYKPALQADRLNGSLAGETQTAETVNASYYSAADAAAYIRDCMTQRKSYFKFDIYFSYQPGADALGELLVDMWYMAMEHNGIPTQGDYLYWHWAEFDPWDSLFWNYSDGTCKMTAEYYAYYYTSASQESALTNKVNQIINGFGFTAATTDYEKAYTIYNWVTKNIRYDYTGLNNNDIMAHTAYKGVMQGTCVCQGYASIIYRMFLQVGIPCRVVAGDASSYSTPNDNSDDHGWNIAQINGKWYNLDSTWDEGYGPNAWDYFLLCPSKFTYHTRWDRYNDSAFHRAYPMSSSNFNPSVYNGLVQINGYWGYYKNGFLQKDYTGLVSYNGNQFYVQGGILDMGYTGLGYHNGEWFYIQNGVYKTGYTGLVYFDSNWFYVANSKLDFSYTGLVNYDNTWYYVENGVLNLNYTGLAYYGSNIFYVINGVMDFSYTGLAYYQGEWRYVANSQLTDGYTGLVYFDGNWFYTVNSRIDWTFTGLVPYNGNYFYVQNNLLNWSYTGLGYHNGGWYYIENGLFKSSYNSLVYFNDTWFYMESGQLTFSYTGLVPYQGNYFYVVNSAVDWSYTGYVFFHGTYYYVKNGLMVW